MSAIRGIAVCLVFAIIAWAVFRPKKRQKRASLFSEELRGIKPFATNRNWYDTKDAISMSARSEYFRLYFREARRARKRLGLCVQCGQQPAIPSRTRCSDCNDDQKQADLRYRQRSQ